MTSRVSRQVRNAISFALVAILLALIVVAFWMLLTMISPVARAADYALPLTGTSRTHGLAWQPGPGPLPAYFVLESTPIFGPPAWRTLGTLQYASTCVTTTSREGRTRTACRFGAGDRTATYLVQPCNVAGCGARTVEDQLIRCCRIGEFDLSCFVNMLPDIDCH